MVAAEHMARYLSLRKACKGKRVLDVACGEGYGSFLMKNWGASEVVGIDLSGHAIENACKRFSTPGVTFLVGDACRLDQVIPESEKFDLIVSFETLEHVPDVPALLRGLRTRVAPDGTIAISCPNDPEIAADHPNEFHLKTYSFEDFKNATTDILGPATQWQIGTPVIGFGVCDISDDWMREEERNFSRMLDGADSGSARFLPAQSSHAVNSKNAHFYMGVWGAPLPRSMAVAPISYRAYVGPWDNWMTARDKNEKLMEEVKLVRNQIASEQAEKLGLMREFDLMRDKIASETAAKIALTQEIDLVRNQIASVRNEKMDLAARYDEVNGLTKLIKADRDFLQSQIGAVRSSRAYRLIKYYYGVYDRPLVGLFLRPLRKVAGLIFRKLRR